MMSYTIKGKGSALLQISGVGGWMGDKLQHAILNLNSCRHNDGTEGINCLLLTFFFSSYLLSLHIYFHSLHFLTKDLFDDKHFISC
jgi:hypothetical protein